MSEPSTTTVTAQDEVVELCQELLRIDTSNYGDGSGPGERKAAEWVAAKLDEVGLEVTVLESEPGRTSVVARVEGEDRDRPPLLVHGHLDVVPANAADWQVDPFSGEVRDGCVWGRGAVDMKDMDAMVLAVARQRLREGRKPARDLVLAFVADEEAGGKLGAHWLVDHHPDLFADCSESISEVGGFSFTVAEQRRVYLIQTAQKGIAWMKLTATGRAGHGSFLNDDNAVTELCEAVARLGSHPWPLRLTPTVSTFLDGLSDSLGVRLDPDDPDGLLRHLGAFAVVLGATLRNTTNPTGLQAGYKHNVIPQTATALVDGRFLPGYEDEFFATVDELLGPHVQRETLVHDIAVETSFDGALVDAMAAAIDAEDPGATCLPYCLSGGTDDKSFSLLGVRGFGFAPLKLPPDLDFAGMFHGIDERVPVDGLQFGTRVLDRLFDTC